MFSYSKGYYVSPPDDQNLKFKNRCSLLHSQAEPSLGCLQNFSEVQNDGSTTAR